MRKVISQLRQEAAEDGVELVRWGVVVGLAADVMVASEQGIGPSG